MRLLLWGTAIVVILGSGAHPLLKDLAFYGRFAMYGVIVLYLLIRRVEMARTTGLEAPIVFLLATCLASMTWSVSPGLTAQRFFGFGLLLAGVVLIVRRRWTSVAVVRSDLSAIALAAVAAMGVSATLLVNRDWAYSDIAYGGGLRFTGVFENPNEIGLLGALIVPLLLGLAATSRTHAFLWYLGVGVMLLGEILAQSRGGLVALVVGLSVFTLLRPAASRRAQIAGLVLLVAAAAPLVVTRGGVGSTVDAVVSRFESEGLGSGRFIAWGVAVDAWEARMITGYGYGTGDQVFTPLVEHLAATNVFVGSNPHNAYLMALLEIGPLGALLLVMIVLTALKRALSGLRSDLRAALAGSLAGGLVISMVESGATSAGSIFAFNFWFVLAATVSISSLVRVAERERAIASTEATAG